MPQLICAIGLVFLTRRIKVLIFLAVASYFISIFLYLQSYYHDYPKKYAEPWQYGYKEVVQYVKQIEGNYEKINVTPRYGRPYIYFLFYGQVPLDKYLSSRIAKKDSFGFWQVDGFGKYNFTESTKPDKNWLYVRAAKDVSKLTKKKIFKGPDGKAIFAVTEQL